MSDTTIDQAWGAHWAARDRLPGLHESYSDASHSTYQRYVDGQATRADYEHLGELAEQIARLHTDEADYFTRMTAKHAEWASEITSEGR